MPPPVKQIETITKDLKRVVCKIEDLAGDDKLSSRQQAAVASLCRAINGVCGWELGMARQLFGLDQNLINLTRRIKSGPGRGKDKR